MNAINNYIEIGVCLVLLAFLLWMEGRVARPRLAWRVAGTVIAVAALLGLILPLTYRHRLRADVAKAPARDVVPVEGIVRADWPRRLYTGERLEVRGRWKGLPGSGP